MEDLFTDVEQTAIFIRNAVRDVPDRLNTNNAQLTKINQEIQDLMHVVEFSSFNASDGYRLAKDLKIARKKRRELKNELELLEPLVSVLKKFRNNLQEMDKAVGEIRKVKALQQSRTYKCRVREDLQIKL
ncbi:hypothetical protein [Paraliobacillus salinarum]|uniref:hypothetical protein n=1 Tax=Paraliobacillus salinarum TaxID=1158996 RepID=UPI0015F4C2DA|nr:hypothetical protein [Paraliobacillus salinarum]